MWSSGGTPKREQWFDKTGSWATFGMIGFGNGRVGRRFSVLDSVYGVVLTVALLMTIDLDYTGIGLIRVSNLPVVETLAAMN
jgi:hypothetical protein